MAALYRISVTVLEKFRRWLNCEDPESKFDNEEAFLQSLKGLFRGTPKSDFGGAYHQIIEGKYEVNRKLKTVQAGGFFFTAAQAAPAIAYREQHPAMVYEMNSRKIYHTKTMPIQVSGRIDGLEGIFMHDGKTKFRQPVPLEYYESCQWKFYLDMEEGSHFYYDIFEIKNFDEDVYGSQKLFPDVVVEECVSLLCTRYDNLESDIKYILNLFVDYITIHDLFKFLKPAWRDGPHLG